MARPDAAARSDRYASLDVLRGVGAVLVVVHHCVLTDPSLAAAYRGDASAPGWARIWTHTPLHLLWSGAVLVYMFFVLSGFVLALPGVVGASWTRYWVRRLVRLYVPVWFAVLFAYALVLLVPRAPDAGWWMQVHTAPPTLRDFVVDLEVVRGTSWANSPLWSLRWEILFSLLLPLTLPLCARLTRRAGLTAAALLVAVGAGVALEVPWLTYFPMFYLGVLLAHRRDQVADLVDMLSRRAWWVAMAVALLLTNAPWYGIDLAAVTTPVGLLGASGLVALCLSRHAAPWTRWRPGTWLGSVSFALYLVHEPIVVTAATLLPGTPPAVLLLLVLPPALAAAWIVTLAVERPSRRLASRLARSLPALHPRPSRPSSAGGGA